MDNLDKINYILSAAFDEPYKPKELEQKDILEKIKTNYIQAYNAAVNGDVIYRGFGSNKPLMFEMSPKKRVSENTSNVYTLLMSEMLPSWEPYPKRNQSFICSLDHNVAADYGTAYVVLPINNTNVGICPADDIWNSFKYINKKLENLQDFNYALISLLSNVFGTDTNNISKYFRYDNINKINDLFNFLNVIINNIGSGKRQNLKINHYVTNIFYNMLLEYYDEHNTFNMLDFLDYLLNSERNGFKLCNIKNFINVIDTHYNECWFSAPALFIKADIFEELF